MSYFLLDSGSGRKLERFGNYTLVRPCSQAIWQPSLSKKSWDQADASFSREEKAKGWRGNLPEEWQIVIDGLIFKISPTDFGHLGIFPEHEALWSWGAKQLRPGASVLNLFAYSGGATLAFARAGASVCHVDASHGMVKWGRENAVLSRLADRPIRWIVDDVKKFLLKEQRRGRRYDAILLDPPSFGRGAKGEVFKIEKDLSPLLKLCSELLSDDPIFLACSNHSHGFGPTVMHHLFDEVLKGNVETGELLLKAEEGRDIPTGVFAKWTP